MISAEIQNIIQCCNFCANFMSFSAKFYTFISYKDFAKF